MTPYPAKIRRCRHIRTNGTQCGSPALRKQPFCYFHREVQPQRVEVCGENGNPSGQILVPVFEDANSIQTMVRRVTILLLEGKIDSKKAGQVLYALQIASSNLKRMEQEKPRPTQVVIDERKTAKTPLGATPWTANAWGPELDEPADIAAERALREVEEGWKNAYKDLRGWLVGQTEFIQDWHSEHPRSDGVVLESFLSRIRDSLKQAADLMGRNLQKKYGGWPVRRCEHLPPEVN